MNTQYTIPNGEPEKKTRSLWTPIFGACLLTLLGLIVHQNLRTNEVRTQIETQQRQIATLNGSLAATNADLQKTLSILREQLASNEQKTTETIEKARASARQHADALAVKLARQQAAREVALTAELSKVKESAQQASEKLSGIDTEVATVKTDVASTRTELQKSLDDLQRMNGDLGVMSGLIATNSKEIQTLRELGDRNIYEFTLNRKTGLQRVGDISLKLKKADRKRNRYTMVVLADDKTIEKKDKTTNEPVQFYVLSQARTPYELVVNEVSKDTVKGYLATPKVRMTRAQ